MKSAKVFFAVLLAVGSIFSASAAPPTAESLMKAAQDKAGAEGKNVFLIFSTTGCTWCKVLKNFIEAEDIKPVFAKYFVTVHLMIGDDENTNPGANKYDEKYGPTEGTPYTAFITPGGKEIVDSKENGGGDNIGYPVAPNEIAWFMGMLKKAAPKMTAEEVKVIETKLKAYKESETEA